MTHILKLTIGLAFLSAWLTASACSQEGGPAERRPTKTPTTAPTKAPMTQAPAKAPAATPPAQPQATAPQAASPAAERSPVYVLMTTSEGEIVLELDAAKAPVSVENFLGYTESGFYDGTIFHRVMSTFMIQGGGFTPDLTKKDTGPPIVNEWQNGLKNKRGTIALARLGDPNSATSQFFINVADNAALDQPRPQTGNAAYAVFGKVVTGMDVVDAIKAVPTGTKSRYQNVPIEDVVIESVRRLTPEEAQQRME